MPSQSNLKYVEDLKQTLDGFQSVVLMSFESVAHRDFEALRRQFREHNGRFQVVKNRLFKIALQELELPVPEEALQGPIAMGIAYEDPSSSAKLLLDFVKEHPACVVKAGLLEGHLLDAAGVDTLSKLPSREELLAQVVAVIGSPIAALTRLAAAPVGLLALYLENLKPSQEAA